MVSSSSLPASLMRSDHPLRSSNVLSDEEGSVQLRVGIHISDVIVEPDGDLLGDGVNIAARLQGIADPGTICLSEDAFHQIRDKISVATVDKGDVVLKNMPRPVHVYALHGKPREDSATDRPPAPVSAPHLSIVVLPFANLGQLDTDVQFADGITESLTTDLARIPHSAVIARNTAFTFKGKAVDARQIGQQLNVRYILEGSVQRSGDRIRVNVQLIDAESGNHLWADRFDKASDDLLRMQDEIVARVANALNFPLMAAEADRAERSAEPASIDLYFQGMAWVNKGLRPDWLVQARSCFEKARAIDNDNLEALVGIAMVDTLRGVVCAAEDPKERLSIGRANINRRTFVGAVPRMGALPYGCGPYFHAPRGARHNGVRAGARTLIQVWQALTPCSALQNI